MTSPSVDSRRRSFLARLAAGTAAFGALLSIGTSPFAAANTLGNAHFAAAGIVAVNRVQERGYSFAYVG